MAGATGTFGKWEGPMRLFVALTAALSLLLPASASARVDPGGGAHVYQLAEADWLDLKAKTFYFAMGIRGADAPSGPATRGFVGRGECQVHRTKHFTVVSCSGRGYGGDTGLDGFQIDPALGSAHLELTARGFDHVVDWTGEELPMSGAQASGGGFGVEVSGGAARWAPANADLFGEKLRGRGHYHFGILVEGAGAYVSGEGRTIWFGRDGLPRVRATYRIPR